MILKLPEPCPGNFSKKKNIALGTQPMTLQLFHAFGANHVFACSDRPTVVYHRYETCVIKSTCWLGSFHQFPILAISISNIIPQPRFRFCGVFRVFMYLMLKPKKAKSTMKLPFWIFFLGWSPPPNYTLLFSSHKLVFSNVNQHDICHMCPLNTSAYPDALALASTTGLTVGSVAEIQKLHIQTIPLGETAK